MHFVFVGKATAKDPCEEYKNVAPQPAWYSEACKGGGGIRSKMGGAFSTFGDAFNLNPSAIVTRKLPLGVEFVRNFGVESGNNFAIIKGFGKAGLAATTNSDHTFYGNSIFQSSDASTTAASAYPTMNFGSAFDFGEIFNFTKALSLPNISVGLMAKYNKQTAQTTPAFGFNFQISKVSFGYSYATDPDSGLYSERRYDTFQIGTKLSFIQVDWVMIINRSVSSTGITATNHPAYFLTMSKKIGPILATAAYRSYESLTEGKLTQYHFGAEYSISGKLAIMYLDNYVVGARSLGLQAML